MTKPQLQIKKNVILAPYTTFAIGGQADYFCQAQSAKHVIKAIKWAKDKGVAYHILGGGSNVLVSDQGVRGLVIRMRNSKFEIRNSKLYCEGGVIVNSIVNETVKRGLKGLEYFAGLPGTVGGAIYNNSHYLDHFFSDCLEKVEILDEDLKRRILPKKEIDFSYDYSSFQQGEKVILGAIFRLKKINKNILEQRVQKVLARRKKHPSGKSSGCIFRNPKGKSAGYLIEKVGLKGKRIGGIEISRKHANFFINTGGGKGQQVVKLIKLVQKKVNEKFGVKLEPEIFFLGDLCLKN